ncbi:aspartate dehydrogenase [Shimazuella alba]|uniref:L-aspartate dehydrogenase n=1 Tax=Shimazuella alba TaxID=2690964 RepID=A0A6I4W0G0_9BACL|nr:aspartate dehydrogenase [Shimazuella alba]MXQ55730.1 aspartate dehydrogenase [Shimazuella alba]
MKIGLIGTGNIGQYILRSVNLERVIPKAEVAAVYTRVKPKRDAISVPYKTKLYDDFDQFIKEDLDLVIEAATIQAVEAYAARILESKKNLLLVSVGALADADFLTELKQLCDDTNTSIYLPSGAIGGLDILKAAKSVGELNSVSITTRKPPKALLEETVDEEVILFEGTAKDAISKFPKNINVAIVLSLAGLGVDNTKVRIIADPYVGKNNHTIEATGSFGKMTLTVENDPMPSNPKTSYLAAISVISTLKNLYNCVHIG